MSSTHTWAVDAIEDGIASIEVDGDRIVRFPAWLLPSGAKEGDLLVVEHERGKGTSTLKIEQDVEATEAAREKSKRRTDVTGPEGKGDVAL